MDILNMQMMLLPLVWPLLLGGFFLHVIPDLARPELFFGVTVDPRFRQSELARGIRRRYSVAIWIATLIAVVLAVTAAFAAAGAFAAPVLAVLATRAGLRRVPWMLQVAVGIWAFVQANRAARAHATQRASVVEVELSTRPDSQSTIVAILAVPIASLAVLAAWTGLRWRDVPSRVAVHWTFNGPDRWVATTPATVAMLLSLHAVVCLLFALLAWGVFHGSRRVATYGEAARREQRFRARIVLLLLSVEYFAVFPAWAALLGLPGTAMRAWMLAFPTTILILQAILVLAGQGGSRGLARSGSAVVGDRTDDHYWTWGLFYFNRADPAFLVEKRFGVGYTFNFAHPFAWALLTLIAAIPLLGRLL